MKKFAGFIWFFVIALLIAIFVNHTAATAEKLIDLDLAMKKAIGEKVVIEGDTVEIVNYNLMGQSYTLSNGTEVDMTYVEKNLVITTE